MPYRHEGTILADLLCRASRLKPAAFKEILTSLLSTQEIEELERRWNIIQLLAEGRSYRTIADELAISKTTVTKIAHAFQNARDSFQALLPDTDADEESPL